MNIGINGIGIVSAIGNDAAQVHRSLVERRSGIGSMQYLRSVHKDLPVGEVKLSDNQLKDMLGIPQDTVVCRTVLLGTLAIRQALADASVPVPQDAGRVCLVCGTTVGGMDVTESHYEELMSGDGSLNLMKTHDCGACSEQMAELAGLEGAQVCTVSTACSSALNAISLGARMLENGEADYVIAGGSEALSQFHLNGFNTLMILDHERCRPFDATRAGLNLGEGAAFLVMTRSDSARYAYVTGWGNRCDAYHQTATSDDGLGARLCMQDALDMAGLKPSDIPYVNAHATGTPNNDRSESQAIYGVFADAMPLVSGTKSLTGHTTSASGAIEAVLCLMAMKDGLAPAAMGVDTRDEACVPVLSENTDVELRHVLCNSFGFGGNDSAMVLSAEPGPKKVTFVPEQEVRVVAESIVSDVAELSQLREFVPPMESRRMGRLLKAAMLTSMRVLKEGDTECPDAIITATAYGMMETSMKFLDDMCRGGEQLLGPTLFMQSTHNTIGSSVAIRLGCHGYNTTYTQGAKSMEWALRDARDLIRTGKARTVLVGCHDEGVDLVNRYRASVGLPPMPGIYSHSILLKAE